LSTPFQLLIPGYIFDAMISQAYSELPNECCGLLAGVISLSARLQTSAPPSAQVTCRYPLINTACSPTEFLSDARGIFEAVRDMRRQNIDILAVYHSHPTSAPIPSRTDRERNYSSEVMNFIISLQDKKPLARAWWLTDQDFREADWRLSE